MENRSRHVDASPRAFGDRFQHAGAFEHANRLPGSWVRNAQDLHRSRRIEIWIDKERVDERERAGRPAKAAVQIFLRRRRGEGEEAQVATESGQLTQCGVGA